MTSEKEALLPAPATSKPSRRGRKLVVALGISAFIVLRLSLVYLARSQVSAESVRWAPCPDNHAFQCGMMEVPKDYHNHSTGTSRIAMARLPATVPKKDRLGTLFMNPGGPGGSGVLFALQFGPIFHQLLEGKYDLLGFDPRGIGATEPRVECFSDTFSHELFKAGTVLERGFDIPHDPFSTEGRDHLLEQHRQLMAMQEAEYRLCGEKMGDELRYMGTSTVVRDIEEMSRVLDGPEAKINFFGGSYGTILGAYLVNMIPEKIGRVVIDGVASAPQWANTAPHTWLQDWMVDTEKTFQWFLRDCAKAGPTACALARHLHENTEDIEKRLMSFLDGLYDSPQAVPDGYRPGVLNSGGARTILYASTNGPGSWPRVAKVFADALDGRVTDLYNALVHPMHLPSESEEQMDLSRVAVSCLDSLPYQSPKDWPTAEDMVASTLNVLNRTSPHFGASVFLIEPDGGCQFWPAAGKSPERFTGPWNATLQTPMMIVSNTADPITPLASGRELDQLMGSSSRLLVQNSPGHCSLGSVSTCTTQAYRDYLVYGKLPKEGTVCEVDQGYFPSDGQVAPPQLDGSIFELSQRMATAWTRLVTYV